MGDAIQYEVYPLIINSSMVVPGSNNSKFRYQFPQGSVTFNKSKCAISNINIFYSWFNFTTANNNTTLSYIWPTFAGTTTYNVTIPNGFYDVAALNSYLQSVMIQNGTYLVNASGDFVYYFELVENSVYYSIQFNSYPVPTALPAGYSNPGGITFPAVASTPQLVIPNTNIQSNLGFAAGTYPTVMQATNYSVLSTSTPQITSIESLILSCTLLNNRYSVPATVLYSFGFQNVSFGTVINSEPTFPSWVKIQDGNYTSFDVQFLDQNFAQIAIQDPNLIIQILIANPPV